MSKPDTWKSWEGRLVDGKFPLRQWLGGSDHSAVFLTDIQGNSTQKAVIKLVDADNGQGADRQLERVREAAKLSHPCLIRTFETGRSQIDGAPITYVVMECADDDLSQILPQRALDANEVTELLPPVLKALSYLHSSGFVHSRIKPSNVLAVGNQLKLSSDQVVHAGEQNGQRRRDAFDAPETAAGIVTPAGDIWSFGVTMIAALTQDVDFARNTPQKDPGLPASVPEPYRGIAQECLHLDPNQRCGVKDIESRLRGERQTPPVKSDPVDTVPASANRSRAFVVTAVLAGILLLLLAFFHFHGNKPDVETQGTSSQPAVASPPAAPAATPEQPKPAGMSRETNGAVARQVLPEIPQSAKNTISGTIKVVVKAQVDASGKVTSAAFKSAGSSHYFANHALQAAQRWEFTPPQTNGQASPSTWLIQFRFKKSSTQASAERFSR